jgi:hypothetical protein
LRGKGGLRLSISTAKPPQPSATATESTEPSAPTTEPAESTTGTTEPTATAFASVAAAVLWVMSY